LRHCSWYLAVYWLLSGVVISHAANIKVVPGMSTNELTSIVIAGDIVSGDANEFLGLALNAQSALVFLNSDGGDAAEGLLIAKAINRLGYGTAVIENFRCMSACALVWVSGKTRFLSKNAIVGFHAVYSERGVSSDGNAIYGAFYGQLGLSDRAIRYLTSAPPDGYNQLSLETAPVLDIAVNAWDGDNEEKKTNGPEEFFGEEGVAISGFDIPNESIKTADVASCYRICASNQFCKAYTFDLKASICYQKNGGRVLFANKNAYSGARREINDRLLRSSIGLLRGVDIVGNDLQNFAASHVEACMYGCETKESCKAFSFSKKRQICWLKSADKPRVEDKSLLSGVK
jgi:PAN domain